MATGTKNIEGLKTTFDVADLMIDHLEMLFKKLILLLAEIPLHFINWLID
jgi:hypothetical protein